MGDIVGERQYFFVSEQLYPDPVRGCTSNGIRSGPRRNSGGLGLCAQVSAPWSSHVCCGEDDSRSEQHERNRGEDLSKRPGRVRE